MLGWLYMIKTGPYAVAFSAEPNSIVYSDCIPCGRWTSALSTVGIFLTFLFVPEPLRVPLAELDRRYAYHTAGKVYHGASLGRFQ